MTAHDDLFEVDLDDEERKLMVLVLDEYGNTAQQGYELLGQIVGQSTEDTWWTYVVSLNEALKSKRPLSELDWARALFLTEVGFASDMVGSGRRFGRGADQHWIVVLRSLQDKLSNLEQYLLLRSHAAHKSPDSVQGVWWSRNNPPLQERRRD